jgi:hypothetical protein
MADEPYKLNPKQIVQTSQKLWSEIVESVDPAPDDSWVYEWSNGRKFKRGETP